MNRRFLLLVLFVVVFPFSYVRAQTSDPTNLAEPIPLADEHDYDIVNFLLIGSDTTNPNNSGRTDALMVISVNRTAGTVALLSIPRDLYVYIPGSEENRINVAFSRGESEEDGGGPALLIEVIRHNLGLQIDHYARVDFGDFREIIDMLDGVDIAVDCAIEDWRLHDPSADTSLEESWALYTLPAGMHHMDSDLALWYVRSRRTSSDFDRGRRQQEMIRAVWRRVRELGLMEQITDIWPQATEVVDTDLQLNDVLPLIPMAASVEANRISAYTFRQNVEVVTWSTPGGASVLLPQREAVIDLMRRFLLPATAYRLFKEDPIIEVVNASGIPEFGQVAVERLAVEGFEPHLAALTPEPRQTTTIYDYVGQIKGSSLQQLQDVLRVSDEQVILEPDPNRNVDFRVVLGADYQTCTRAVLPPQTEPVVVDQTE